MGNKESFALFLVIASSIKCDGDENFHKRTEQEGPGWTSQLFTELRDADIMKEIDYCIERASHYNRRVNDIWNLMTKVSAWRPSEEFLAAYLGDGCYKEGTTSSEYAGRRDTTVKGHTCQTWEEQSPHEHKYTNSNQYPDVSLHEARNFCRDPSNSGFTWCYTTDPEIRWEACEVTECLFNDDDKKRCWDFNIPSMQYTGTQDMTTEGLPCQRWASQFPHEHRFTDSSRYPEGDLNAAGNYCRDPEGWGLPWCYTTDPNKRWGVCDLARCTERLPLAEK